VVLLGAASASGQAPAGAGADLAQSGASAAPAPAAPPAPATAPSGEPARSSGEAAAAVAPPLYPPPAAEAPGRPGFLRTEDELRQARARRSDRERRPLISDEDTIRQRAEANALPASGVLQASPWVDFTLTSFWMNERVGNFLNLGVQVGGYFFDRLRLSARLVTPLDRVDDDHSTHRAFIPSENGLGTFQAVKSADVSVLYTGSIGIILASTNTFVLAPGVLVQRTDVNDYGTSIGVELPFEWTTKRHLRIGFALAVGHGFGGDVLLVCNTNSAPLMSCGRREVSRPSGTTFLLQYNMGWALGHL
jgi:hypothetical protein